MNPIEKAIESQKQESVQHSVDAMIKFISQIINKFKNTNLTITAPYPKSTLSKKEYQQAKELYSLTRKIFNNPQSNVYGAPHIANTIKNEVVEKMIEDAKIEASRMFDSYINKLTEKVGACDEASFTGFLWNYSILTVRKGNKIERWKTQMIINCSSLGKLFNQFPTRLMKD